LNRVHFLLERRSKMAMLGFVNVVQKRQPDSVGGIGRSNMEDESNV